MPKDVKPPRARTTPDETAPGPDAGAPAEASPSMPLTQPGDQIDPVAAAVQATQASLAASYAQMREALRATQDVLTNAMVQAKTTEQQSAQQMQQSMQAALEATRAALAASARDVLQATTATSPALRIPAPTDEPEQQ